MYKRPLSAYGVENSACGLSCRADSHAAGEPGAAERSEIEDGRAADSVCRSGSGGLRKRLCLVFGMRIRHEHSAWRREIRECLHRAEIARPLDAWQGIKGPAFIHVIKGRRQLARNGGHVSLTRYGAQLKRYPLPPECPYTLFSTISFSSAIWASYCSFEISPLI